MSELPYSYGGYKSSCENKKRYDTYEDAKATAKTIRKNFGPRVSPYLCRHCKKYHIGHSRNKNRKLAEEARERLNNPENKNESYAEMRTH